MFARTWLVGAALVLALALAVTNADGSAQASAPNSASIVSNSTYVVTVTATPRSYAATSTAIYVEVEPRAYATGVGLPPLAEVPASWSFVERIFDAAGRLIAERTHPPIFRKAHYYYVGFSFIWDDSQLGASGQTDSVVVTAIDPQGVKIESSPTFFVVGVGVMPLLTCSSCHERLSQGLPMPGRGGVVLEAKVRAQTLSLYEYAMPWYCLYHEWYFADAVTPTLVKEVTRRSTRDGITTLSYRFLPSPELSLAVFYAKSLGPPLMSPYFKFNRQGKYLSAGVTFLGSQHKIYQKVKVCPPLPICPTASGMPCLKA
jgi:hypothetical protein